MNENVRISIKISLKFVPNGPINNIPALVQMMAWRRLGDRPLSESMMVRLPTHIYVIRPQWINIDGDGGSGWDGIVDDETTDDDDDGDDDDITTMTTTTIIIMTLLIITVTQNMDRISVTYTRPIMK